jgi:hypothetical protein
VEVEVEEVSRERVGTVDMVVVDVEEKNLEEEESVQMLWLTFKLKYKRT